MREDKEGMAFGYKSESKADRKRAHERLVARKQRVLNKARIHAAKRGSDLDRGYSNGSQVYCLAYRQALMTDEQLYAERMARLRSMAYVRKFPNGRVHRRAA